MVNYVTSINNLTWTVTNGAISDAMGHAFDTIQSKLANDGRDTNTKFYWDYGAGGKIINVAARHIVGGAVSAVTSATNKAVRSLLGGKKVKNTSTLMAQKFNEKLEEKDKELRKKYGKVSFSDSLVNDEYASNTIFAYDDWNEQCVDALMLYIPTSQPVKYTQNNWSNNKNNLSSVQPNEVVTSHLVWYDTTALINLSSDKNVIFTRVQGRDYSRKELVSNGDINFSVSGHIVSNTPDVYPTQEVQKFRQIMQYKGLVSVNNEILDQWGIEKIVIKSFSLPPSEGRKSVQDYSFEAVGIQPAKEANVTEDTLDIYNWASNPTPEEDSSESLSWKNMLKSQLEGLKTQAADLSSQVLALAGGFIDDAMCKEE